MAQKIVTNFTDANGNPRAPTAEEQATIDAYMKGQAKTSNYSGTPQKAPAPPPILKSAGTVDQPVVPSTSNPDLAPEKKYTGYNPANVGGDLNDYMDNLKRSQRTSQDKELEKLMGSVGLDSSGAAIPDWQPPQKKEIATLNQPSTSGLIRSAEDLWLGMREGASSFYHLGSNVFGLMDKTASTIENWTGLPKAGGFAVIADALKQYAKEVAPTPKDLESRDHFIDYVYRAVGAAPATIGTYIVGGHVAGSNVAGMAIIDALRHTDEGAWESIKGGLQGALMGYGLKYIEPFSRPVRAILGGAGFGGLTAFQGGTPAEIAAQTAIGGGMAAIPGAVKEQPKRQPKLSELRAEIPREPVRRSEIIRQPDLTQKSEPIQMGDMTKAAEDASVDNSAFYGNPTGPAGERVYDKEGAIRQPDLATKGPAIELPDLTQEGKPDPVASKLTEELESAKIEADGYIREKGIGAILENARKQTTDPTVRKMVERENQKKIDEELYGSIRDQLVQPDVQEVFDWRGRRTPEEAMAEDQQTRILQEAADKGEQKPKTPRGRTRVKNTPEEQARQDETTRILQEAAAAQIEHAAAELNILPQDIIHTGKVMQSVVNAEDLSKPTPVVTATDTATGQTKTFQGKPGQRHADVVVEHNLDTDTWQIIASDWNKGMAITEKEAARLKEIGATVREYIKGKLKDQTGAVTFDPSRRKFLKAAAGAVAAAKATANVRPSKITEIIQSAVKAAADQGIKLKSVVDFNNGVDFIFSMENGAKVYSSAEHGWGVTVFDIKLPNDKKIYTISSADFDKTGKFDPLPTVELGPIDKLPKELWPVTEVIGKLDQDVPFGGGIGAPTFTPKLSDVKEHRRVTQSGTTDLKEIKAKKEQLRQNQEEYRKASEEMTQTADERVQQFEADTASGAGQVYELSPQGDMIPQPDMQTGRAGPFDINNLGFSTFDINFAIARTLAGAVYGYSQGDTMEERLINALVYGGLGGLANPAMAKTIIKTFKHIDPEGIKRVEYRDQGMSPTVDQAFNARSKMDPAAMAEFLRMTNEGIDITGRVNGINYDHINTPMDAKYTIGKMAKVYQKELDKVRKVEGVTHEETIASAEALRNSKKGAEERFLQWPDGKPMTDSELLVTRLIRNDLGLKLTGDAAAYKAEPTQANMISLLDTFNRYRMIQKVYGGEASGSARHLESLKIDIGASGELEFHRMIGDVVEAVDPTGWTPTRLADAIAQIPNLESLNKAVDIAARPGMHDMLLEAFYNVAMLSNPKTWVVNGVGAPIALTWQVGKRAIAGGMSAVQGRIGDPSYVQPVEPLLMMQAIKDSYHDALTISKKAFDTGERQYPYSYGGKQGLARPNAITYDNLRAIYPRAFDAAEGALSAAGVDAQKLKYGIDLLGRVARTPSRLMLTADEFNELIGARMELYARSGRSAAAEGLTLNEIRDLTRTKIDNMEGFSNADKQAAKEFALYNTFNQDPGSITTRITGLIENLNKSPDIDPFWYLATKAVVPFVTIPANIGRWAARESGPTAFLSRQLKEQIAKGGAEAQTAWAGVALGSMILTLAANMAMNGYLDGAAPVNKSDRLVWEADGHIEYSVHTPIGSFGINRLDPVAIPFAWAADFVNLAGHIDAYDSVTLAATALLTLTHDLASKNYVQGVTNFFHAVTSMDSKEIQQYVKNQTGALMVPGLVRAVRQETDPYRRATNSAFDAARQATPWGSTDYPPVLDRFGRPVYSGYGAGQGWASIFGIINPIQYRAPNESAVIKEVTDNKIPIPGLSDTIFGSKDNPYDSKPADSRTGVKLENWEFYQYNKYSGEKLFELLSKEVQTPRWKNASSGPDGGKAMIFNLLVATADETARQRLLRESPELRGAFDLKNEMRKQALKPLPGAVRMP